MTDNSNEISSRFYEALGSIGFWDNEDDVVFEAKMQYEMVKLVREYSEGNWKINPSENFLDKRIWNEMVREKEAREKKVRAGKLDELESALEQIDVALAYDIETIFRKNCLENHNVKINFGSILLVLLEATIACRGTLNIKRGRPSKSAELYAAVEVLLEYLERKGIKITSIDQQVRQNIHNIGRVQWIDATL